MVASLSSSWRPEMRRREKNQNQRIRYTWRVELELAERARRIRRRVKLALTLNLSVRFDLIRFNSIQVTADNGSGSILFAAVFAYVN